MVTNCLVAMAKLPGITKLLVGVVRTSPVLLMPAGLMAMSNVAASASVPNPGSDHFTWAPVNGTLLAGGAEMEGAIGRGRTTGLETKVRDFWPQYCNCVVSTSPM